MKRLGVAQPEEFLPRTQEVGGSNPPTQTRGQHRFDPVAQRRERRAANPEVEGSSPSRIIGVPQVEGDRNMSDAGYEVMNIDGGVPVKSWTRGVPFEDEARVQLRNVASLPFIQRWVAAMPDVHWGIGATVGSVIPTVGAVIPAAVGVDIGCGMMAVQTSLAASDLPESLQEVRTAIERA